MKKYLYLILTIFILTTIGSSQNNTKTVEATINGWSNLRCICCEGWIIEVDGQKFIAESIPNGSRILGPVENRKYPIKIYLDYRLEDIGQCTNRMIITFIMKR